jgi:prophage regulatory protein
MVIMNISEMETGFLRLSQVLKIIPVGKTSWYKGVKNGIYPKPIKLGLRASAWKIEDTKALIERLGG